jgi:hypothetical protein
VACDVRQGVVLRLQVAGLGGDDDGELDLPVGLGCLQRDPHVVVRTVQGVRVLEEDDRDPRRLGAGLRRVCCIVLTYADGRSRAPDRSADALTGHVHGREVCALQRGAQVVQTVAGEEVGVVVVGDRGGSRSTSASRLTTGTCLPFWPTLISFMSGPSTIMSGPFVLGHAQWLYGRSNGQLETGHSPIHFRPCWWLRSARRVA